MTPQQFSVIMPLHNKAPHVAESARSVLQQSLSPLELIIIDDCSTDGGREIAAAINDPRVRILDRQTPGPGGYAARNLGIREAKGEWIAFLDADDLWREDHLEVLAHAIADAPNAGAAATRFDHVFENRRQPQRIARRLEQGGVLSFRQFLEAWLEVRECPLWTGAIAFRRDLLIEAGLFPEGRAVRGGDKDLWLRVMRLTRLVYAPVTTAEFSRESVNKVSNSTDTLSRPCLVEAARALMAGASRAERRLLRRLINQEIGHYVRYSMKGTGQINIPAGEIALPEGIGTLALLMAARWLPASLRQAGHSLSRKAAWP
jgi:cellulose synthase/poly-beta-1,6-N-acetylglucosamine synthase-like glycosyltransferase